MMSKFTHVWYWRSRLPERKGRRCRVLARGRMNSILVEFGDGFKVITSRFAIRLMTILLLLCSPALASLRADQKWTWDARPAVEQVEWYHYYYSCDAEEWCIPHRITVIASLVCKDGTCQLPDDPPDLGCPLMFYQVTAENRAGESRWASTRRRRICS